MPALESRKKIKNKIEEEEEKDGERLRIRGLEVRASLSKTRREWEREWERCGQPHGFFWVCWFGFVVCVCTQLPPIKRVKGKGTGGKKAGGKGGRTRGKGGKGERGDDED